MVITPSGLGRLALFVSPPSTHRCHQILDSWKRCPLRRYARDAPREALPWSMPQRIRPSFAFAVGSEGLPADQLWWGVGSPMKSLQISCTNAEGNVLDPWRLSELMMDLGAMSVSVDDSSLGTDEEEPIMDDEVFDLFIPSNIGRKDMWGGRSRVKALFPGEWDLTGIVSSIEEVFDLSSPLTFEVENLGDKDWVKSVQEGWDPIEVGRLRIRFPWHEALPPSQVKPGQQRDSPHGVKIQVELELEGGGAFGTGEHPTTSMCLEWLEENAPGQRVLDYGSGSGILGLAALKFGAKDATGVELDLGAILSAAGNADRNGLRIDTYHPCEVCSGDELEDIILTKVSTPEIAKELMSANASKSGMTAVRAGDLGTFDLTIANILAAPLVRLHAILANLTRPGGKIALSGVLETQADTVMAAYEDDFSLQVSKTLESWVIISGVRKGD